MKQLVFCLLVIVISGCTNRNQTTYKSEPRDPVPTRYAENKYGSPMKFDVLSHNSVQDGDVIIIDDCEYICYDRGLTHKGNCKNPIHKHDNTVQ